MVGTALRSGALLVAAGLSSEAVYLLVTARLSWWRYGGNLTSWSQLLGGHWSAMGACLAGIGVLMAAYLAGWLAVKRGAGQRVIVWGFAALFAVTLLWLLPITSDLFTYLGHAHLFTDLGRNPFLDAPLDFGDALLWAFPTRYASRPSVYGPAWVLASAPGTVGPHDVAAGVFYLKVVASIAYLGCAWLLERVLQRLRPAAALEGLYLFAWNPLVLLMAVGDGHNDIVMMAAVLLALWLLVRQRWVLSFGVLAFSVWIKYVSAMFVPFFALYAWNSLKQRPAAGRWTPLAEGGLVTVVVSVLVFAPFWSSERMPGIVQRFLHPMNWHTGTGYLSGLLLGWGLFLFAAAAVVMVWRMVRRPGSLQQLVNACFAASLLAFVLGATRSQPWHLLWPATLAGLSDRIWAWPLVVGLSALMLVVQVWVEWGAPGWSMLS